MPRRRRIVSFPAVAAVSLAAGVLASDEVARAATAYDWLQFNGNAQHSGNNTLESSITSGNVASLKRLYQVTLPATADGAPAVLTAVSTSSGTHDLLFLNTKDGRVLALDAHTGATIWAQQVGPGSCHINNGSSVCYTTSSPAVDPARNYVYAYGLDGSVHKYAVGTGTEVVTGGWPELATTKAFDEKGSSALTIATASGGASYLYATNGGYPGDNGDYQGHVTTINLATGAQNVFNSLCSNQTVHFVEKPGTPDCAGVQSAIWARSGVIFDSNLNAIFMATGNGTFDPTTFQWGDSVFRLTADGLGSAGLPIDSYTPGTFQTLDNDDHDLGSTAPAILPTPSNSNVRELAVQSGKDAMLRLLNLANLSSQGGPGHLDGNIGAAMAVPQGGVVLTAIASWVNPADGSTWAFVANGGGISGLHLAIDSSGNPSLTKVWQNATGGSSPMVANNVLYVAASANLRALNPTTGTQLWQDTTIGSIHWESPVVANGVLYITDDASHITAYSLPVPAPVPALPIGYPWLAASLLAAAGLFALRAGVRGT